MAQQLTPMQTLILWALIAKGGGSFARKDDIKPEVKLPDRKALVKAGLIRVEKRKTEKGRDAGWLEVTDSGWEWASENITAPLSPTPAGTTVLRDLLMRLQAFMQARNISLAELIVPSISPQPTDEQAAVLKQDYPELRERVRSTYKSIAGEFNKRVRLCDLREKLEDVSRTQLDDTLRRIASEDDASLMPLDNRREITEADRQAAIKIGDQQRHILWISQ